MSNERRSNWKQDLGDAAKKKAQQREALLVEKELVSKQLGSLTMEQVRSSLYTELKKKQAELVAKLATL